MKKFISFMICFLIFATAFVPYHGLVKADNQYLYQIGTIGVMPDDYIGAFSLNTANTYESDFKSDLSYPMQGMTITPDGNIAVCDTSYGRVHILSPDLQNLLTFGEIGYGEGKLQYPADIAVDSDGNFYIADFFNNYWSKFDKNGKWILNAGTEGTNNGQFNGPSGIAVDLQGNVYVSDQLNNRIQVFDKNGNFKSILQTEVSTPGGMCTDANGNLYVVDMRSCTIFKLDNSGKTLLKFGSAGTSDGQFVYPFDVSVDKSGNIFVIDRGLGKTAHAVIQKFDSTGKFVAKIGGNASRVPQEDGKFLTPGGFAVDGNGFVYVIDSGYFYSPGNPFGYPAGVRLTKFDASYKFVAKKDYDVNAEGRLMSPWAACEDSKGNIWITSWTNFSDTGEVDIFTSDGRFVKAIRDISDKEPFTAIGGIASDRNGSIYIALGDCIAKFDENFNFVAKIGDKKVSNVFGLAVDASGNIWAASNGTQAVVGFKPDGTLIGQFSPAHAPVGLCLDKAGNFYITTADDNKVYIYSNSYQLIKTFGGGGRGAGKFWIPYGIAIDKDGNILVSDTENGRIQAFKAGTYELLWSTPREFYEPVMLSWTKDGNLLLADCFHSVVRVLSTTAPVTPQFEFDVRASASKIEVKEGSTAIFNLVIRNLGASDDSYSIKVESTFPNDWTISSIPEKVDVKAKDQIIIPVSVGTPITAQPESGGKLSLEVSSVNASTLRKSVEVSISILEAPPVNVSIVGDRIGLGQSTTIKVMTEKVEELYGVSMTIQYDSTFLKVDKVEAGGILGQDAVFLENHDKLGTIIVGYSLKGKAQGVTGDGAIASISFTGLKEGNTSIEFTEFSMFDSKGNVIKSSHSSADILVYNPNPPTLTTNIQDGLTVSNPTFSFTGKTDPGCKVTINGSPVNVGADGSFSTSVYLSEGANTITIVSTSKYNISNKIVRTVYLKTATVIVLQIGKSNFTVNGEERTLDAPPMIKNGRTLLPIRAVVEALGGTVAWDNAQKKVTIVLKDTTIELWIGKNVAKVNGVNKPIDSTNSKVVPEIVNGRTMLPLRFVTENLGATVDWDNNTKTVTITYKP
ncbi:MAG: SMP-30/gluconolactonase/LRE family protein [Bacteroidales bacterium]|nr:SMP-30/gluconolactonase/LRE family protein [Bacteroidales bacterium]